jgi:hypothetical protein
MEAFLLSDYRVELVAQSKPVTEWLARHKRVVAVRLEETKD